MPAIETACRKQKAVFWAASGFDNLGDETVSAGISIDVRFEIRKSKSVDPQGNVIGVDATAVVDRAMTAGGIIWMGNIDDIATPPINLWQIQAYNEVPDVKGRKIRRTVDLVRYSNELPTIS